MTEHDFFLDNTIANVLALNIVFFFKDDQFVFLQESSIIILPFNYIIFEAISRKTLFTSK